MPLGVVGEASFALSSAFVGGVAVAAVLGEVITFFEATEASSCSEVEGLLLEAVLLVDVVLREGDGEDESEGEGARRTLQ